MRYYGSRFLFSDSVLYRIVDMEVGQFDLSFEGYWENGWSALWHPFTTAKMVAADYDEKFEKQSKENANNTVANAQKYRKEVAESNVYEFS